MDACCRGFEARPTGSDKDASCSPASQVHQALKPLYPHMGITADMIGTYGATDNACRKLARKI
jgi:hypothetical protein